MTYFLVVPVSVAGFYSHFKRGRLARYEVVEEMERY